ncbi:MAG: hypothetical protein ACKVQS_02375 [Fimbriimonadaceae bacterium]
MRQKALLVLKYGVLDNLEVHLVVERGEDEGPLLVIIGSYAVASQKRDDTDALDWGRTLTRLAESMRQIAGKSQNHPHSDPLWGLKAGNSNFEVFMTPSFKGNHLVELWVLDEYSAIHVPFTGRVDSNGLCAFANDLQCLLGNDWHVEREFE